MYWHEVGEADLIECLNIEPRVWGDEIVGRERAFGRSGRRGLGQPRSVRRRRSRQPAFGQSQRRIWLRHVRYARVRHPGTEDPQPGLNSRIVASVVSGQSVIRPEATLSVPGACVLDVVILSCNYLYEAMDPEQIIQAEMTLPVAFAATHVGYRLNRILSETVCDANTKFTIRPVFGVPSQSSRTRPLAHRPHRGGSLHHIRFGRRAPLPVSRAGPPSPRHGKTIALRGNEWRYRPRIGGEDESLHPVCQEALGLVVRQDRGRTSRSAAGFGASRMAREPRPAKTTPHPGVRSITPGRTAPISLAVSQALTPANFEQSSSISPNCLSIDSSFPTPAVCSK